MAQETRRSLHGVVVSLAKQEGRTLRVIVDEVTADCETWPQHWTSRVLLTHRDFPAQDVLDNRVSSQHLAELTELTLAFRERGCRARLGLRSSSHGFIRMSCLNSRTFPAS
jgi:hypothetical protein